MKVKQVVDSFGAHGIDIDYESDSIDTWNSVMVKPNVIGKLRAVMPAGKYIIKLTTTYGKS